MYIINAYYASDPLDLLTYNSISIKSIVKHFNELPRAALLTN